jgi:glycosyltransferase involved in cell wall biosynthesis
MCHIPGIYKDRQGQVMFISVVMATYNGAGYIREQLDSIARQKRLPDEIVISDDASADGTWDILEEYRKDHPGLSFILLRNEQNMGYRRNFLRALQECTEQPDESSHLYFLCDQDDVWLPEKLEVMERIFGERGEIQVLASSFTVIDGQGVQIGVKQEKGWSNRHLYHREVAENAIVKVRPEELIYHNFAQGCAMAFRSQIRKQFIRNFTEEVPHDWQIAMSGAVASGTFFYNKPLFRYRIHGGNVHGLKADASAGKSALSYRTTEARNAFAVMEWTSHTFPSYFENSTEMRTAAEFLKELLRSMTGHDCRSMMRLIKNPEYRKLKSRRARAADLFFTLLP